MCTTKTRESRKAITIQLQTQIKVIHALYYKPGALRDGIHTTRNLLIHDGSDPSWISEILSWVSIHDGHEVRHVYRFII